MPSFSFRRIALAAFAFALALPGVAAAGEADDLRAIVHHHYPWSEGTGPGLMVGVWQGDASVLVSTQGYADLDLDAGGFPGANPIPLLPAYEMRIASLTKTFTVTRVLQLVADGHFSLDTPLAYFEGMSLPNGRGVLSLTGLQPDSARFNIGNPVTVRHLANMTSSLADYSKTQGMLDGLINDLTTVYTPEALLDFARNEPATTTPWAYSNTNTLLLGMIVEAVTGNDLGSELHTHVIAPAGLHSTYYPDSIELNPNHAHGYGVGPDGDFEDQTATSPSIAAGAGAMVSTFDDLRLWTRILATGELADGTSLYGEGDFEGLHGERLQMVEADGPGPFYDLYGLGVGSIEEWIGHSGEFLGYQHVMMYDPETDRTIVIMLNAAGLPMGQHLPVDLFTELADYYAAIPEPSTVALLVGSAGLFTLLHRRRLRS